MVYAASYEFTKDNDSETNIRPMLRHALMRAAKVDPRVDRRNGKNPKQCQDIALKTISIYGFMCEKEIRMPSVHVYLAVKIKGGSGMTE
jgi:hypothetical protein